MSILKHIFVYIYKIKNVSAADTPAKIDPQKHALFGKLVCVVFIFVFFNNYLDRVSFPQRSRDGSRLIQNTRAP